MRFNDPGQKAIGHLTWSITVTGIRRGFWFCRMLDTAGEVGEQVSAALQRPIRRFL
jgi:hypothetical protein